MFIAKVLHITINFLSTLTRVWFVGQSVLAFWRCSEETEEICLRQTQKRLIQLKINPVKQVEVFLHVKP